MAVVEMREPVALCRAKFGDMGEKPKPQILGTDIAQKVAVERFILRLGAADHDVFATAGRLVPFTCADLFVRHAAYANRAVDLISIHASRPCCLAEFALWSA